MREMQLTIRLQAVADQIPSGCRLADVGTDHGRLPIWLIKNNRVQSVIASDLRKGPLKQAEENIIRYRVNERIELRLCSGLTGIQAEEIDVISICGMGGETILHILEDSPWAVNKRLILQPQSNLHILRRFLQKHGYRIEQEWICRDREHFYPIWSVCGGHEAELTPGEAYGGRLSHRVPDPLWQEYTAQIIKRMTRELGYLERSVQEKDIQRRQDLKLALEELKNRRE